jgi:hypothetical protein
VEYAGELLRCEDRAPSAQRFLKMNQKRSRSISSSVMLSAVRS